jgi:hypothetical protein
VWRSPGWLILRSDFDIWEFLTKMSSEVWHLGVFDKDELGRFGIRELRSEVCVTL